MKKIGIFFAVITILFCALLGDTVVAKTAVKAGKKATGRTEATLRINLPDGRILVLPHSDLKKFLKKDDLAIIPHVRDRKNPAKNNTTDAYEDYVDTPDGEAPPEDYCDCACVQVTFQPDETGGEGEVTENVCSCNGNACSGSETCSGC